MANSIIHLPKDHAAGGVPERQATPMAFGAETAPPSIITVAAAVPLAARWQPPIFGSLAVIFGVAALLTGFPGRLLLAPLAVAVALAAGFLRQTSWAVIGGASAVVALATSESFWALLGLAWLLDWLF